MPKKKPNKVMEVSSVLHIYCEGEKTEPAYLEKYIAKNKPANKLAKVIKIEPTKKNTPIQLVEVAIENQKKCPKGDEFWVVFDRESNQKYPDELHHKAFAKANAKGIEIALSNVCFELWILLHFKTCATSFSCYDDLMNNSDLKKELLKIGITKYDKGQTKIFDLIQGSISEARIRANEMNQATVAAANPNIDINNRYLLNPFCDVFELLDAIDAF